jgi:hypothetical protein
MRVGARLRTLWQVQLSLDLRDQVSAHFSGCSEFAHLAEDLGEAVGEPVEARAGSALW